MKINNLFKSITITSLFFGAMVLSGTTSSKAVLQSNGNTGATYNLNDWIINVRKMEQLGGAMGLSETLNSNLTSSSDSNNIDVHMQKNTEYGALAILSASSYGNPNKINDGETTTGNVTGAVMKLNSEWVAAGNLSKVTNYANAVGRYKNIVNDLQASGSGGEKVTIYAKYVSRVGDAISETKGWHGSDVSEWISYTRHRDFRQDGTIYTGLLRSYSGSIFSYYGYGGYWGPYASSIDGSGDAYYGKGHTTRAVIVQGEGV